MKQLLVLAAAVLSLVTFPSPVRAERISVSVKGMVCSFCAQGIKKTFGRKESVQDVAVDLDTKMVTITTKNGAALPDAEIRESIVDSGYEVVKIERTSEDVKQVAR